MSSRDASEMQRAKSPLIRLLQTTADRYKRSIETNNSKVKNTGTNLRKSSKVLTKKRSSNSLRTFPEHAHSKPTTTQAMSSSPHHICPEKDATPS